MKRALMFSLSVLLALGMLTLGAVPASAGGRQVVYTFAVADLGQGVWGGGPLNADGSVGGHIAFSAGNGQLIYHLHGAFWFEPFPGFLVICFTVHAIKGPAPPSPFCAGVFVSGTPVLIDFDGDGNPDFMIRATPAN